MIAARLAAAAALIAGITLPAEGQPEVMKWLNPETLGKLKPEADYFTVRDCARGASEDGRGFRLTQHKLSLTLPLWSGRLGELSALGSLEAWDLDTRARLPDTGETFPEHLWDVRVGAAYRRKLAGEALIGGVLTLGSASDRPFASADEVAVSASAFLRLPSGQRNAWLVFLNYSNTRSFLPHVPLPGAAYLWRPDEKLTLMVGVPISSVTWRPVKPLTFRATGGLLPTAHAKVSYQLPVFPVQLYAGFDWGGRSFLRHDRRDADDRLFYYDKKVKAGLRWQIAEQVYADVFGGYAFDRFFFEADGYDDRDENRLDLADGPFFGVQVGVRF